MIVVSHDQDFLNNVVTDIIHLQERKLLYYKGNYEHFKLVSLQAFNDRVKAYEKQQKKLRAIKKSNTAGKKGDAKNQVVKKQREKGARSAKKAAAAAAMSGGTSSESKTMELLTRPKEYTVKIEFPSPTELSPPIINVKDISFKYGEGLPTLFTKVDFGLDMQSRVSMVGPNGVGKSTLLSLILGDLNPTSGDVRRNHRLRIGKYNQHFVDVLPMDKTPVSYLQSKNEDMPYQKIRNHLGKYGLGGHAHEILLKQCSGGQKARVVLASLALVMLALWCCGRHWRWWCCFCWLCCCPTMVMGVLAQEFRAMFNHKNYDMLRKRFECEAAFPEVYDKVCKAARH